jgi:predicted transposase YbfD/YdcC
MNLSEVFADIPDWRHPDMVQHHLSELIAIAVCAMLSGADTWVEVEAFGRAKEAWLKTWLRLAHGIPSHDTFGRVFAHIDPAEFMKGFARWVEALQQRLPVPSPDALRIRAIDGKQCRRSHDRLQGIPALHEVSVWASESRLILANQAVETKSNEITAIPLLLRQLDVAGCLVTIDAMGCQTAIAQQILNQQAQYVLALKGNQGTLATDVQDSFEQAERTQFAEVDYTIDERLEKGHGRIERRRATVITDEAVLEWIQQAHAWPGLQAIGRVESERRFPSGACSQETRYYLLSAPLLASRFQATVRGHWGIENQVHWVLDMAFLEDQSRVRVGHGAENLTVLRRLAVNILRQDQSSRMGIKARRMKAAWDLSYLLHLLSMEVPDADS